MSIWTDAFDEMNQIVDADLSDDVLYKMAGGGFLPVTAFVLTTGDSFGGDGIDALLPEHRLKVHKSIVVRPQRADRVRCAELLGSDTWQPAEGSLTTEGQYWIFKLQKVQS
jgi:hypothetical protein